VFQHSDNPNFIVVEDVHVFKLRKIKKIDIDVNCKFQDVWAFKMPWAQPIFNEVRLVTFIKCHVCSKIEKKNKVLVAKWDSTETHASKKKLMMVSGLWIQNVGMQKMKMFMFNC